MTVANGTLNSAAGLTYTTLKPIGAPNMFFTVGAY